ncbi:MAG TPA: hypothetical protein VH025_05690, partial [Solirubrobacteraceae bacterium]|nr:hypothetical protein [Solirubrobacteraceae bacterium]
KMPVNFDNPTLHGTGALNTVTIDGSPTTLILASHSLYCATTSITLSNTLKLRDVGFVAPAISWAAPSSTLTGYQGFYGVSPTNYGGFLFDAYGSGDPTHGGVSWSSGQDGFTGAIFAPNATASLSGSTSSLKCDVTGLGSSDSCGFVEARTISLGGSGFTWQGTGPTFGAVQQCLINGVPLPGWQVGDPCQQTVTTKSVGGLTG